MSAAPGRAVDTWCPRCDDLAAAAPGTPCARCAAPRILIEPPRPARPPAGRPGGGPAAPAGRSAHGAGARSTGAPHGGGPAYPSPAAAPPAGENRREGAPTAYAGEPAGGAGREPGWDGRGAVPADGSTAAAGVAAGPGAAGRRVGGRKPVRPARWLVVGVLGAGVVIAGLGRLLPLVPTGIPAGAASAASGPRSRPPPVPLPTARPRVVLPARGPMLGRGASGWMVVQYDGWLWRQPLRGGAPHPVARLPQGASRVALSPRGDRVALVRSGRLQAWQTRVEVRSLLGGVLEEGASGSGPSWGPDGRLAFVAVADAGLTGMSPSRSRHPTGPVLHLVGGDRVDVLALPGAMHGVRLGWAGDGHPLLLPPDAPRSGLFAVERGHLRRVLPAGHGALAGGSGGALTTGLLRPRDAAGPLGAALAALPSSLAAIAPEGRRVALVTGPVGRPQLEVRAAGRRTSSALPPDRYRSVHWSPGGDLVWVEGEQALLAVDVASGRVGLAGPALPGGAELLGFTA